MDISTRTESDLYRPLAPAPPDGLGFTASWPVRTGDVDPGHRLRLDGVSRYLQDVGSDNLDASELADSDPVWIVRRTVIDVVRPVSWPDRVHLRRWCAGLSTRWSAMRVRVTSDKGALIETEGFWININPDSGMPARISDRGLEHLGRTTDEHRLRWRAWLDERAPDDDARGRSAGSPADVPFPLRSTDLDPLDHVNNAAYWHAVEQHLQGWAAAPGRADLLAGPHRAVLEYRAPITEGENVRIRARHAPGSMTLWFLVDDEVRAIARVAVVDHYRIDDRTPDSADDRPPDRVTPSGG
ncbi:acyl-[acyl-carrier-protein] thioesterase [Rhodococcus tukisamuensis]|uniref:Acyl-ACP thioesterase n=1 Tax=Rhodococcus tukisamuensis TaxID=168276 RepID=A0A1G6ZS82_9NOCA|nr:acyl-ACP thioesterase domain-containing protein [Rhodococcus tukisamuensis]SDE05390.1 Acyl-ACP thioesterase [Rhodococcus tukisamuensis]